MARWCLFPAMALLCATFAGAQQALPVHDEVVVTATGDPTPLDEVPAATSVFTAQDLKALDLASVADVLRLVPGATLLRSGLDGDVTSLFVRGTNSNQTLVLFDGVRLNSPFFGGYDWSLPLTLGVGQVEVVRGPYSALYGADALGGVVQMFPARASGNVVRAFAEAGSDDWRRGEVEASLKAGSLDVVLDAGSRTGSGTLPNDDFSSRAGMVDIGTTLGENGRVGLLLRRSDTHTEVPFSGALVTPHRYTAAVETLAAVPLHLALGGGELELALSRVEREVQYRDPDDPSGFVAADTRADSDGVLLTYHERWRGQRFTLGGEWRRDTVTDGSNFGLNLSGVRLTTQSWFAEDHLALSPEWEILAGLRWDDAKAWGGELSPRVTLGWGHTALRGWVSYGRAFRAPALGELYYPFSGNPTLRPEHSGAFELGAAVPAPTGAGVVQLVGFSNRETNLIDFDLASYRFVNVARALQDGVEASWIAALDGRTRLEAALTWLDARDDTGAPLLRRPRWSGALAVTSAVRTGVDASVSVVWVGARVDADPVTLARVQDGGFVTASAAVKLALGGSLAARARVENLADRSYEEVRGYPAPRRRFMLGLETVLH
ncbi:MAG: TonB-dependent receptor plug domain-containing protein [Thermoanaerobaculales bacterium]